MNERQLRKFIDKQGLIYHYSYLYKSRNDGVFCRVIIETYPYTKPRVIYFPCRSMGYCITFEIRGK